MKLSLLLGFVALLDPGAPAQPVACICEIVHAGGERAPVVREWHERDRIFVATALEVDSPPAGDTRMLVRFAVEDIGLADPQAVHQALAAKDEELAARLMDEHLRNVMANLTFDRQLPTSDISMALSAP